ncbi:MAG: hypothetical protein NDJ92_16855 [Thermoanaerobaculia bacterium]|nr:hypothetical protein [Thermoanaerobaculia bacterium]
MSLGPAARFAIAVRLSLLAVLSVTGVTLGAAPSECVPERICRRPEVSALLQTATLLGTDLKEDWIEQYAPMLLQRFSRPCKSYARCLAVWGNSIEFCQANLKHEIFAECDSLFDRATAGQDAYSCRTFANIYSIAQASDSEAVSKEAQACSRAKSEAAGPVARRPQPRVVVEPKAPRPGDDTTVIVRSFDGDGDPVMALVRIAGVERGRTFTPMPYGFSFDKSWDDEGRTTLTPPAVVVYAPPARPGGPPAFEPVTMSFETRPRTVRLEVTPPVERWKKGSNRVRVVAVDAVSGTEVQGRLKTIGGMLGPSGATVEIRLEKGTPPCGAPVWFAADQGSYAEADLGISRCATR